MKKLLYIALLLTAFISLHSKGLAQGAPPFRLQEVDGSPSVLSPTVIKVTNGALSCSGKTCTITVTGGSGSPGGAAGTVQWNDTGSFNGTSGLTATATTVTIVSGVSATFSRAGLLYTGTVTTDNASVQTMLIQGDRATVASNDEAYITYRLSNAAGTQTEVARQTWAIPTTTAASENGRIDWSVMTGGALAKELQLSGADLSPSTSDGLALGTTSLQWSDLFLASGAVLDFANGNVVLTHSSGILTMGTGELRITTVGTNTASVPTLGSVSTLSNKTLATGTAFAGYSDIATIAAPANPSAGNIRLYADSGTGNLTCLTSAGGNCLPSGGSGITIGTTTITSGTATRLLYETAGNVVGEISGATSDGTTVTLTSPTVNTGITLNAAPLTMSGNISAAAWTTNGIRIKGVAATLTDTTSSGTVAAAYTNNLGGNTIAASSATTFTDYYTAFITGPTAGSNVTLTRSWALGLSGNLSVAGLTALTPGVTTGTGTSAGLSVTANSLTTGNGVDISSSSVTSGSVASIAATGTAAASNTKTALLVSTSGANGTSSQTTYGARISNSSTGTSSINIGLLADASGGSTTYPLVVFAAGSGNSGAWFQNIGGFTRFQLDRAGNTVSLEGSQFQYGSGLEIQWGSSANALTASFDLYMRRRGAASLQLGTSDGASPVAQSLTVQRGTGTNTSGASAFNIIGSTGTGTGTPGRVSLQTGALSATSGTTAHSIVDRHVVGATKVLTNNTTTTLVNVTNANNTVAAGIVDYAIEVFDGTDVQVEEGQVSFHVTNKGGTIANNSTTTYGNQQATTAGTLSVTWSISAANPALLQVNANSSLSPSSGYPRITYNVRNLTSQAIAVQ